MKPYYEHGGITLYLGDCREIMANWVPGALILTDPPYGINYNPRRARRSTEPGRDRGRWNSIDWDRIPGDDEPFDPTHLIKWDCILWGANNYAHHLPPTNGWLFWDKMKAKGFEGGHGELAWTNLINSPKKFAHLWDGFRRDSERGEHHHPTQKPVELMRWCIQLVPAPGALVIDPYMGSGTTLVAAKQECRPAVGIDISEKMCEVAALRLAQEVLPFGDVA